MHQGSGLAGPLVFADVSEPPLSSGALDPRAFRPYRIAASRTRPPSRSMPEQAIAGSRAAEHVFSPLRRVN